MAVITDRENSLAAIEEFRTRGASMAVFCSASHWNTEAILLAAKRYAEKHNIERPIVTVAMTFNYHFMPQAQRVTYSGDAPTGFISMMEHLNALAGRDGSPYADVVVLPHVDHADPEHDRWALTEGLPYLSTVMFDAQRLPAEENIRLTREYVETYGSQVLVEGIMEGLTVEGKAAGALQKEAGSGQGDDYVTRAIEYIEKTKVDFLVADLGTEQQAATVGAATYMKDRARALTKGLGEARLVLHGTSCLSEEQMTGLADDGVIRVNMWTRIAREAGQAAAEKLVARIDAIRQNEFEAAESRAYIHDSIEKAASVMEGALDLFGYASFGN